MSADTTGTASADHLNGGTGNDTLSGYAGNDFLNGGAGSDVLDGGSGSDRVEGDSGNDVLIYRASENGGATDIYDGGSGIDTLRLLLTRDEWMRASVQVDVANYLAFIAANTLPNGQANNSEFQFSSFDLRISKTERLEIYVDGVLINPTDQAVVANNDTITTNEDTSSAAINLLGNDSVPDLAQDVVIVSGPAKGTITLSKDFGNVANPVANVVYVPGTGLQSLAVGESTTDTFTYKVVDADGDFSTATVTVTITGTNDAPLITAEPGDSAGTTLAETNAGLAATGTLTASDVDVSDIITASVIAVTHTGPTGGLSDAQLLNYFQVTAGALDTATTTSGQLTWNFDSGSQAFNFLAEGETLTLHYTIRPDDGHAPPAIGDGVVTIHITGTNDAPVITSGPASASAKEDQILNVSGIMTAVDPDDGAQQFWTVVGGTAAQAASYHFVMDDLHIVKNGNPFFDDGFSNGLPPPESPNFANGDPTTYAVNGTFAETGGKVIMDSSGAVPVLNIGTPDPFIGQTAIVRSNIDPANLERGLKSDDNFTVQGRFDLIVPDSPRETYGIRLSDRLIGGPGIPPDQPGDDLIELVVRKGQDNIVRVQLRELDIVNDQVTNIQGIVLNPPAGADQILLRLTHSTSDVGALHASFDYLSGGAVVGSATFSQVGRIFGTETPGFTGDDENWTRAQILAYAPAITDSTLAGAYGTLTIGQGGAWNYTLANGQANVQRLAEGETAVDSFTVQVTDEHGASDTETINVTVTGTNDAPVIVTGPVSRTILEDGGSPNLTATGLSSFFDVDFRDSHTATATLLSASLPGFGAIPPSLLSALGSALSVNLLDDSTGDGVGQLQWNFAVGNADVQFLAEGQSLSLAYRISVADPFAGNASQNVFVTITGTNDEPTITSALASGSITEDSSTSAAGLIAFADLDLTDTHTVGVVPQADGYLGTFSANVSNESAGDGIGNVSWNFAVNNAALQYLAEGQTLTQSYDVTVAEGHGGSAAQTVTVTINGANDAPTNSEGFPDSGTVTEYADGDPLEGMAGRHEFDAPPGLGGLQGGGFWVYDVDLIDNHDVSVTPLGTGYLSSVAASIDDVADSFPGQRNDLFVNWTFSIDDAALDPLAAGETRAETYRITATDNHGASTYRDITVNLVGSNDAPIVTPIAATVAEDAPYSVNLLGAANAHDVDATDTLSIGAADASVTTVGGRSLTLGTDYAIDTNTGAFALTSQGIAQFNALATAASDTLELHYQVTDGHAAVDNTLTLTVNGANDAPVISQFAGGSAATAIQVPENTAGSFLTITATDAEHQSLTYSIGSNPDGSYDNGFFSIDANTGALRFATPPDFEFTDPGNDDLYKVQVTLTDTQGGVAKRDYFVQVTDVNEGDASGKNVAVFDNGFFVDTVGGAGSESDTVQASLTALGFSVSTFTDFSASGFASALAGKDVLVFPEQERGALAPSLSTAAKDVIKAFVSDGGNLVINCDYNGLVNGIFGFSTNFTGMGTSTKTTSIDTFADDPATLPGPSATIGWINSTLPTGSVGIYQAAGVSSVAAIPYGHGEIVLLGWDWFNGAPLGSQDGGWLQVLASASQFDFHV